MKIKASLVKHPSINYVTDLIHSVVIEVFDYKSKSIFHFLLLGNALNIIPYLKTEKIYEFVFCSDDRSTMLPEIKCISFIRELKYKRAVLPQSLVLLLGFITNSMYHRPNTMFLKDSLMHKEIDIEGKIVKIHINFMENFGLWIDLINVVESGQYEHFSLFISHRHVQQSAYVGIFSESINHKSISYNPAIRPGNIIQCTFVLPLYLWGKLVGFTFSNRSQCKVIKYCPLNVRGTHTGGGNSGRIPLQYHSRSSTSSVSSLSSYSLHSSAKFCLMVHDYHAQHKVYRHFEKHSNPHLIPSNRNPSILESIPVHTKCHTYLAWVSYLNERVYHIVTSTPCHDQHRSSKKACSNTREEDLIYISHDHLDHFDPVLSIRYGILRFFEQEALDKTKNTKYMKEKNYQGTCINEVSDSMGCPNTVTNIINDCDFFDIQPPFLNNPILEFCDRDVAPIHVVRAGQDVDYMCSFLPEVWSMHMVRTFAEKVCEYHFKKRRDRLCKGLLTYCYTHLERLNDSILRQETKSVSHDVHVLAWIHAVCIGHDSIIIVLHDDRGSELLVVVNVCSGLIDDVTCDNNHVSNDGSCTLRGEHALKYLTRWSVCKPHPHANLLLSLRNPYILIQKHPLFNAQSMESVLLAESVHDISVLLFPSVSNMKVPSCQSADKSPPQPNTTVPSTPCQVADFLFQYMECTKSFFIADNIAQNIGSNKKSVSIAASELYGDGNDCNVREAKKIMFTVRELLFLQFDKEKLVDVVVGIVAFSEIISKNKPTNQTPFREEKYGSNNKRKIEASSGVSTVGESHGADNQCQYHFILRDVVHADSIHIYVDHDYAVDSVSKNWMCLVGSVIALHNVKLKSSSSGKHSYMKCLSFSHQCRSSVNETKIGENDVQRIVYLRYRMS